MMESSKSETKSFLFMFIVLVISSAYTTFSDNTILAIVLCMVPIILLFIQVVNELKVNIFFLIWVCWNILNALHMSTGANSYFFRVLIFQNIVIMLVYLSSQYCCSTIQFKKTQKAVNVFTVVLCMVEILFSVTGRAEGFSFVLFGLMYFFLCDKGKLRYIKLALMMIAFWVGRSRSSMLMLVFCLLCYCIIKRVQTNKAMYKAIFYVVAATTYLVPYVYIWLYRSPYGYYINSISRSMFGKNFFSGRQKLWGQISEWLEQNGVLWGIGSKFVGGIYSQQLGVSTHNVSLFLLGQGGIFLLVLFFVVLYKIYMSFYLFIEDKDMIAASAFLLGLMMRSSFDLILIANQFIPSMYAWLSICLVLSYCNYRLMRFERAVL